MGGTDITISRLFAHDSYTLSRCVQEIHSRLYRDLPEEEGPNGRHCQAKTPDNGKTNHRINLRYSGQAISYPFHTIGQGIEKGYRYNPGGQRTDGEQCPG